MLYLVCSVAQKLSRMLSRISRRCCKRAEPLQSTPQIPVAACVPRHKPVKRSCQSGTADLTTGHWRFSINTWSFRARTFWRLNPAFVNKLMGRCVTSSFYRTDNDSKHWGLKPALQDGHHTLRRVLTGFRKNPPSYIQNLVSSDELRDIQSPVPMSQFSIVSKAFRRYLSLPEGVALRVQRSNPRPSNRSHRVVWRVKCHRGKFCHGRISG